MDSERTIKVDKDRGTHVYIHIDRCIALPYVLHADAIPNEFLYIYINVAIHWLMCIFSTHFVCVTIAHNRQDNFCIDTNNDACEREKASEVTKKLI